MKFLIIFTSFFLMMSVGFAEEEVGEFADGSYGRRGADVRPGKSPLHDDKPIPSWVPEDCPTPGSRGLSFNDIPSDCIKYTPLSIDQKALVSKMYGQLSPNACQFIGRGGHPSKTVNTNGKEATNMLCEANEGGVSGVLCSAEEIRCNEPGFIGEFTISNVIFFAKSCSDVTAVNALRKSITGSSIKGKREQTY